MGRISALVLAIGATSADALEKLEFVVATDDKSLKSALEGASVLVAAERNGQTDTQDILSNGRAEYSALLNALYARGHYSAVIHVYVDGREVADIPPLDDPARVDRVKVTVDPGQRFALSKASVQPLPYRPMLPEGFRVGAPAESGVILEAANAAVSGWREHGNAKARVAGQNLVADHAQATLSADIRIAPGPVLKFGKLTIKGQERMLERRIRKIAGLPEGETFSPEELDRAAARLRRTGVFKSVSLVEDDSITQPDFLGIAATVVEQKPRNYSFGAEVASLDGVDLTAKWLHRNLMGGGERLELGAEIRNLGGQDSGVDYLVGVKLDRPATFTPDTNLGLAFEIGRLQEEDFDSDFALIGVTLSHIFSESLSGRAGLTYGYSAVTDEAGDDTYRDLALPLGLTWDRRDNQIDAKRGFFIDAVAMPFLGFDVTDSGARATLDMRGYKALGAEQRVVLAARFQAGAVFGASLLGTPRDYLFYSGGAGTVRGQPYQSLGAEVTSDGTTFGIGSDRFIGGSLEARVKATESLGIVGFVDFGAIDGGDSAGGSEDWHAGAGLGVRYATGIGPLRFDVAAPVAGTTGDGVQFYIGLGQAF